VQTQYGVVIDSCRKLKTKMADLDRHVEQLETARERVKQAEADLKEGEVLIYRDFVNTYTPDGKMMNLVLVCMWKTKPQQTTPHIVKINNYCSHAKTSGASSWYVADVFEYHLKKEGGTEFFRQFNHIILAGDHGPHFISIMTVHNQSRWFDKYGKTVYCLFLCSYHAYNRCDGAGVETIKLVKINKKKNKEIYDSQIMANVMNESNYSNSVAVAFPRINTSANVFPLNLKTGHGLQLVKKCEMRYFMDDPVTLQQTGIVYIRNISSKTTDERFQVIQTQTYSKSNAALGICQCCSDMEQQPKFHASADICPNAHVSEGSMAKRVFVDRPGGVPLPDDTRFDGRQLSKEQRKKMATLMNDPRYIIVCPECGFLYRTIGPCNTHLRKMHGYSEGDPRLLSKTDAEQLSASSSSSSSSSSNSDKPTPAVPSSNDPVSDAEVYFHDKVDSE